MWTLAEIKAWAASYRVLYESRAVWEGFVCGATLGVVLPLSLVLLGWWLLRRRQACRGICIEGEGGDLTLSAQALRDFLQRIVAEYREVDLVGVALLHRRRLTEIRLRLSATPLASVRQLKDGLKERVRSEMADKLGLDDQLGDVHIDVVRYAADEKRIARKVARVRRPEAPARPVPYRPYPAVSAARGDDETGS